MKRLLLLFAFLFTVVFSYIVVAQELGMLKKGYDITFPEKIHKIVLDPLPAGTYSVGSGGHFQTITAAFNKLSTDGVAGEVILELTDNLYSAPTDSLGFFLNGPIPGAGSNSRVIIKPSANKNVTIKGSGLATVTFLNTNYVTVDGVSVTGTTTLTIHTLSNNNYIYNDGVDFMNNSDHNVMQNIIFINEMFTKESGSGFYYSQTGSAPDSNLIQYNLVKKSGAAFFILAPSTSIRGKGNVIRGNQIGSETDSLIHYGIEVANCENTVIENNIVQNLKVTTIGLPWNFGIISVSGFGDIIRNNILYNFRRYAGFTSTGILLTDWGENNQVYNNMIFNIQSTSIETNSHLAGIEMWQQSNPKIYYNSVYLSGIGGSNDQGSAALVMLASCTNVDVKNNIFVNTRDESPYCASAIFDLAAANFSSDNNGLFCDTLNTNNCLVREGNIYYYTLADWQFSGNDLNSYVEMPHFISSTDLHIDPVIPTYIESHGTPIAGIEKDFDGNIRNTTTSDIGSDEFDGIGIGVGVEDEPGLPAEYKLEQNYPNPFNPSTTIKYSVPELSKAKLTLFNLLGEKAATLVNEEKAAGNYSIEFNATDLPSGVYFYRLQTGDFIQTKKMVLMK